MGSGDGGQGEEEKVEKRWGRERRGDATTRTGSVHRPDGLAAGARYMFRGTAHPSCTRGGEEHEASRLGAHCQ